MNKKNYLALVFIFLLLFVGCSETPYEISSVDTLQNVIISADTDANIISFQHEVIFSLLINEEDTYQAEIKNLEHSLKWVSELKSQSDNRFNSDSLTLTNGATFPLGNYLIEVRDEDGQLVSIEVNLKSFDFPNISYKDGILSTDNPNFQITLKQYQDKELINLDVVEPGEIVLLENTNNISFSITDGNRNTFNYIVVL